MGIFVCFCYNTVYYGGGNMLETKSTKKFKIIKGIICILTLAMLVAAVIFLFIVDDMKKEATSDFFNCSIIVNDRNYNFTRTVKGTT